jgi:hypothetical protein
MQSPSVTFKRNEILHVRVTTPAVVGMVICPVCLVSYQSFFLDETTLLF